MATGTENYSTPTKSKQSPLAEKWKSYSEQAPWIPWMLGVIGAFFLVIAAFVLWRQNVNKKEEIAKEAFFRATQILESEQKKLALEKYPLKLTAPAVNAARNAKAKKGEPKPPEVNPELEKEQQTREAIQKLAQEKLDPKTAYPKGLVALEEVASRYPKQIAGVEAMVYLSNLFSKHGDNERAYTWAVAVVNHAKNNLVEALGFAHAAYLAENIGKYSEAYDLFERATKVLPKPASKRAAETLDGALQNAMSGGSQALLAEYLLGMGRAQEKLGNPFLAKKAYERVLQEHPNSDSAKIAELSIQDLGPIVKDGEK